MRVSKCASVCVTWYVHDNLGLLFGVSQLADVMAGLVCLSVAGDHLAAHALGPRQRWSAIGRTVRTLGVCDCVCMACWQLLFGCARDVGERASNATEINLNRSHDILAGGVPQWCRATTCAKWTASWETEAPSTPSGPRATGEAHSHAHYEDNTSVDHGHGSLRIHRNNRASLSQPAIHTDRFDKEANVRPIRHCHCRRSRCCPCPRWVMPVPVLRVVEGWQCCRPRECVGIG